MKCNICNSNSVKIFNGKILNKYDVDYYFCGKCMHIQTEKAYWLDEAYKSAIAAADTGIMKRNLDNSIKTASVIFKFYNKDAKFLDYAGGYGILTRLMRDIGLDFYHSDKYAKNLIAQGFEYNEGEKFELITAYEAFEHFENPMDEIKQMFEIAPDILFTQSVLSIPPKKLDEWWFYAPEAGQHINFYSNKTLDYIAEKFNKKHLSCNEFHLFTEKEITDEDFKDAILNDAKVYMENIAKVKTKIMEDMEYIKNKAES